MSTLMRIHNKLDNLVEFNETACFSIAILYITCLMLYALVTM